MPHPETPINARDGRTHPTATAKGAPPTATHADGDAAASSGCYLASDDGGGDEASLIGALLGIVAQGVREE